VLRCVAVCCSVLQCVAVCCNVLQCVAVCLQCVAVCCSVLQCVAVPTVHRLLKRLFGTPFLHVDVLQYAAVCCSVLQCVAVCCSVLQCAAVRCSVLQSVAGTATCCSVLQCLSDIAYWSGSTVTLSSTWVCCSVLQCAAVRCSILQSVAVYSNVLQCVAVSTWYRLLERLRKPQFIHVCPHWFSSSAGVKGSDDVSHEDLPALNETLHKCEEGQSHIRMRYMK